MASVLGDCWKGETVRMGVKEYWWMQVPLCSTEIKGSRSAEVDKYMCK